MEGDKNGSDLAKHLFAFISHVYTIYVWALPA